MDISDDTFKIVLIGDSGVGKSQIIKRLIDGPDVDFKEYQHTSTIGIDFRIKKIKVGGKTCSLQIWDTAGQERFRSIIKTYYRGADGIIFVYDVSDIKSFENLSYWINEVDLNGSVNTNRGGSSALPNRMIIGNKIDLRGLKEGMVKSRSLKLLSASKNYVSMETSAKTGENIDIAFIHLVTEIKKYKEDKLSHLKLIENNPKVGSSCC